MAAEHDPGSLGWMEGHPPATDRVIRFGDGSFYNWPQLRWSFNHIEQLVPTKSVWRGDGPFHELPPEPHRLDHLRLTSSDGAEFGWDEAMAEMHTDALAVLHRGKLVHESYYGACNAHTRHIIMSANKSIVGTIAESLIADGTLDEHAMVGDLIGELDRSGYADASVRQVLDMVVGLAYDEDYTDPESDLWRFLRCTGMVPPTPGRPIEAISDVLPTFAKRGSHGRSFAYLEPNIFVLGWIVRAVANTGLAELVSQRLWSRIGAEHDAYYMIDSTGAETTLACTMRDLLRFGSLIATGMVGDDRVLPVPVVDSIMSGGDRAKFAAAGMDHLAGWSYRSQWWVRHVEDRRCPVARGAHGQMLYIDPGNDLVIGRFGSSPPPPFPLLDTLMWPIVDAITAELT